MSLSKWEGSDTMSLSESPEKSNKSAIRTCFKNKEGIIETVTFLSQIPILPSIIEKYSNSPPKLISKSSKKGEIVEYSPTISESFDGTSPMIPLKEILKMRKKFFRIVPIANQNKSFTENGGIPLKQKNIIEAIKPHPPNVSKQQTETLDSHRSPGEKKKEKLRREGEGEGVIMESKNKVPPERQRTSPQVSQGSQNPRAVNIHGSCRNSKVRLGGQILQEKSSVKGGTGGSEQGIDQVHEHPLTTTTTTTTTTAIPIPPNVTPYNTKSQRNNGITPTLSKKRESRTSLSRADFTEIRVDLPVINGGSRGERRGGNISNNIGMGNNILYNIYIYIYREYKKPGTK